MHRNFGPRFSPAITCLIYLSISLSSTEILADTSSQDVSHDHKFVSGKSVEYLPDPIFYDTYVPILFKVPIPRHTEEALTLLWGDVKNCTTTKKGKLCPVAFHLFKVIKKLGDDMGFWKPYYINHTTTRRESPKKRTGYEVICNEIGPHFFRSYTNAAQLRSYFRALKVCSRLEKQVHVEVPPGNWVVDKTVYYKMLESFKAVYFTDLPQKGKVDWAITLNAYTSVHGLLLTNHVMESVRLATAFRICQNSLIPETFVSMSMLTKVIQSNIQNLDKWSYQLVYNHLDQDIEEYYKLPIADCTFSDDYSFFIRILVPIKRSEISHKLVQITAIPFLEKLPSNSGIPERLCRLKLPASKLTLVESSTGMLLDTSCESNQLCKTSEVSTVFENDACTASILTDTSDRELITNTCKFSCFTVADNAFPLIRRVSSDTYIVVGSADIKIHLNCFDKPAEMKPIHLRDIGALKIQLACQCHILYSTHVSYRPQEPCSTTTLVEHILPYHWYNRQLNTTLEKNDKEFETVNVLNDTSSNTSDTEFVEQIDDSQIEKSVAKQEEELEKFQDQNIHISKQTHHVVSEMSGGLVTQLWFLWILVILLAVLTGYLGYQVRKLTRWRELQSYKETRIIYSIPESSDENKIVNKF